MHFKQSRGLNFNVSTSSCGAKKPIGSASKGTFQRDFEFMAQFRRTDETEKKILHSFRSGPASNSPRANFQ